MAEYRIDLPDAPYARVYVLPAQTVGQDIESDAYLSGILQVNIITTAGSGVTQARGLAQSVADAFPKDCRWWTVI
ncbi:phage tail terminator-like protein [Enterobacter hormaechei]